MDVDGYKVNFVPVGGGGPSMTALLGGNIDVGTFTVSEVLDQAAAGEVRVLTVFGPERDPALPDVATAAEEGFSDRDRPRLRLVRAQGDAGGPDRRGRRRARGDDERS